MSNLRERFEKKIFPEPNTGCWLWGGAIDAKSGYGVFMKEYKKPNHQAHRISYELYIGPITGDLCVCHKCDVRHCVNPDHLFLGTRDDNNKDKMNKGRASKMFGEKNPKTALSEAQVKDIIKRFKSGEYYKDLAAEFGIHKSHVHRLARRQFWQHLQID